MIEYLRNILPRVQQYSKSLDHKENYVDKPWVFIDSNNGIHEYEFCRDGRLIMSLDGQAQFGRWEYRPATRRLLIERPTDAILLQNAFIDNGLMILKKSASEDPTFILINRDEVPDLDVVGYLQRYIEAKTKPRPIDSPINQAPQDAPVSAQDVITALVYLILCIAVLVLLVMLFS